ncbi:hypothetical protein [Chondromyces crocatus]|uniref:Amidinotransferase n=1 Tax=Chondromyces crocatus TaxID=52 RepID=A0A0K1ECH1_CHOCO|nr:hypothetical protein [Chondromyces crocatus]AKT38555.1 uncharacterized protein CMC5_027020 [Chondromyces crocatus]
MMLDPGRLSTLRRLARVTGTSFEEMSEVARQRPFDLTSFLLLRAEEGTYALAALRQFVPDARELTASQESGPTRASDAPQGTSGIRVKGNRAELSLTNARLATPRIVRRSAGGDAEGTVSGEHLDRLLRALADQPRVQDVVLTGGDPLALPNETLIPWLERLVAIPHVRAVRIDSHALSADPDRIDDELLAFLQRHPVFWYDAHFNHPDDLDHPLVLAKLRQLVRAGVPVTSQTVLLGGVNDDAATMTRLMELGYFNKVHPRGLVVLGADDVPAHLAVSEDKVMDIARALEALPRPAQPLLVHEGDDASDRREVIEPAPVSRIIVVHAPPSDPSGALAREPSSPVVNSWNEWDPLEEVIVGRVDDACFPAWPTVNEVTVPREEWEPAVRAMSGELGRPYHAEAVRRANLALDRLVHTLESEGVIVRRPDRVDYKRPFSTPDWSVTTGFCGANPRDVALVVGDEIIEAPMPDRSRYYEMWAYRTLLKEYSRKGARWTAAPRPQLTDEQFDKDYRLPQEGEPMRYVLTEFEPTFDAAEFARCGRDLFVQRSHVTNDFGIAWLQRHLGDGFRIHVIESRDPYAIHLDSSFVPLAAGRALVNPKYLDLDKLPPLLKKWDLLVAPPGIPTPLDTRCLLSGWIHLNVLSLDGERILVEQRQEPLIRALQGWGFKPIPVDFEDFFPFVGAFHCATLDVRRRGTLQSYF